jgi:hypothetical protein
MFQSWRLSQKIRGQSKKNVFGKTFPANLPKFILLIYGLLKMSQGQQLPDPELINAKSLDFAKPKISFKNIGRYAATSTYIHVRIPFNFSQILDTKTTIGQQYQVLLEKHEDPFKTITKTTTDVSLMTISASIEDFQDVIKALPQTTEINLPGRPKWFIALGIAIAAAALSSYNAYRITELNNEISGLKSKTDLLVDVSHLHEAHLHHLEDKTDASNITGGPTGIKRLVHGKNH